MTHIWPIIKKNLILSKRGMIKFLLLMFCPAILVAFFGIILDLSKDSKRNSKAIFYNDYNQTYDYKMPVSPSYGSIVLVGEDSELLDKLEKMIIDFIPESRCFSLLVFL